MISLQDEREAKAKELASTIKPGQWLFTCNMKPLQFHSWGKDSEGWEFCASHHDRESKDDASWHDTFYCGLKPISEAYALWFIENEMWKHFNVILNAYNNRLLFRYCRATNTRVCTDIVLQYTMQNKRRYLTSVIYLGHKLSPIFTDSDTQGFPTWSIYELYVQDRAKESGLEYEGL